LGGKDNFPADRADAARLIEVTPELARLARQNREFLGRAVRWAAAQGIAQFLDIGSGLPTSSNTHQVAQSVLPRARVAYVDCDPVVVVHATALLTGDGSTVAVRGDVTRPRAILDHPDVIALIDPRQPVAVIAAMVLHFLPAVQAREVMRSFTESVVPGSQLIISAGCGAPEVGERLTSQYAAGPLYNHTPAEFESLFGGTTIVTPPGLAFAADWRPGTPAPRPVLTGAHVLAGVGTVPRW
ncbi:MAG TPA: SAM-dependent methyltransferase, partial [Trebonia sp.]|nr:SAM-dependent methyltransferase [Trebonia sp.]